MDALIKTNPDASTHAQPMLDPDFARLSPEHRAEVWALEDVMKMIDTAGNKLAECRRISRVLSHLRGYSEIRLRVKYYEWVKAGRGWRSLMNQAKAPVKAVACPRKLVERIYKKYCENNQRAAKPAWRQLMFDLRRGVVLEGVGDWRTIWRACYPCVGVPAECPRDWVPPGMTYRNLQNYAKLTPFEIAASRRGTKAASGLVPFVYSTRRGLLPGQLYQWDDSWDDVEVVVQGLSSVMARPQNLSVMDVASTFKVTNLCRPRYTRPDGTRDSLKEIEMQWLAHHALTEIGYHKSVCVWVLEHGTAAIRDKMRSEITRLSGGVITFRDSDILGKALHAGMFDGAGKGNFRCKALIEASHRLLHYEFAFAPGQTGGNARGGDRPEQLDGLEKYAESIVKAWEVLPPHLQERLWFGGLSWDGYNKLVTQIHNRIYNRTDHDIEGFEANGWMEPEWSVDGNGDWRSIRDIAHLPPAMRELAMEAARTPGFTRMRKWSPLEVWHSG